LLGIAEVIGEKEGSGESRNVEAEVEKGVAVGDEGIGIWNAIGALEIGAVGMGWIGKVVFCLGVIIVGAAGAAGTWEGGEWCDRQREIAVGDPKNAIVVDRRDVEAGGGLGRSLILGARLRLCLRLRQEEAGGEEERCGLGTKNAAGNGHRRRTLHGRLACGLSTGDATSASQMILSRTDRKSCLVCGEICDKRREETP